MAYQLHHVVWELTNACNAKCIHCGSKSGAQRDYELTEEEALRVCDELKELGARYVTLMGGEFFLKPYWDVICKRLIENGIHVGPLTNGLLLNEKNIQKLKELGIKGVHVSIDGLGETHDYLRGVPGLFEKLVANIKLAQVAGLKVGVNTAFSAPNIGQFEDLHNFLKDLGISVWQLQIVENVGNALEKPELNFTLEKLYELAKKITRVRRHSPITINAADNIGYYCQFEPLLRDYPFGGCGGGKRVIGIHANGDVRGCLSIMCTDEAIEGNVRERSLKEIWEDPNLFKIYRDRTPEKLTGFCAECEYRAYCGGGCSAMAYSLTGTFTENPFCLHKFEVETNAKELTEADFE